MLKHPGMAEGLKAGEMQINSAADSKHCPPFIDP